MRSESALQELVRIVRSALALRRRTRSEADSSACLACGSTRVVDVGELRECQDCGYVGRADGGGELDPAAVRALYEPED